MSSEGIPGAVVILGAGTMGTSLARLVVGSGAAVTLVDPAEPARLRAAEAVPEATVTDSLAAATADLVIEAVAEDLEIKRGALAAAEAAVGPLVPILSNTSGLMLADLARDMAHPRRLALAHFFNPADLVPAVEVVLHPEADPERAEAILATLRRWGKVPVLLSRQVPGFVANRVQHAMMRECLALVEAGVIEPAALDELIRLSIGVRLAAAGPLLQRDLNGLDVHLDIARYLYPDLARDTAPPALLEGMVARGDLGRKSGRGFYDWRGEHAPQVDPDLLARIIALVTARGG